MLPRYYSYTYYVGRSGARKAPKFLLPLGCFVAPWRAADWSRTLADVSPRCFFFYATTFDHCGDAATSKDTNLSTYWCVSLVLSFLLLISRASRGYNPALSVCIDNAGFEGRHWRTQSRRRVFCSRGISTLGGDAPRCLSAWSPCVGCEWMHTPVPITSRTDHSRNGFEWRHWVISTAVF